MNYSAVGIANVALQRIGARGNISSFTEDSPNSIKVNVCWTDVFQEVLSERDWKFAKTRVQLQLSPLKPTYGYCYSYALPSDFLRLCKPREIPQERRIAEWNGPGTYEGGGGWGGHHHDTPVHPRCMAPYILETILDPAGTPKPSYNKYLLSNYGPYTGGQQASPIVPQSSYTEVPAIDYIRLISDLTQLMPGFVNALEYRLAAELAIAITEDMKKAESMMQMYTQTLNSASAQLECDDYLKDEAGSQSWVRAGRYWRGNGGAW